MAFSFLTVCFLHNSHPYQLHPWILDRKRVCMNTHLPLTIDNMKKFNSRRRLRSAVVDAFANRLHYYHYQNAAGQGL